MFKQYRRRQFSIEISQQSRSVSSIVEDNKITYTSTQTEDRNKNEIFLQLKEKFNVPSTSTSVKTLIFTLGPKFGSDKRVAAGFQTYRRQAKMVKEAVNKNCILLSPNPRRIRIINEVYLVNETHT